MIWREGVYVRLALQTFKRDKEADAKNALVILSDGAPALPARVTVPAAEAFTALPMGLPMPRQAPRTTPTHSPRQKPLPTTRAAHSWPGRDRNCNNIINLGLFQLS